MSRHFALDASLSHAGNGGVTSLLNARDFSTLEGRIDSISDACGREGIHAERRVGAIDAAID
jgi:hypothetical protein